MSIETEKFLETKQLVPCNSSLHFDFLSFCAFLSSLCLPFTALPSPMYSSPCRLYFSSRFFPLSCSSTSLLSTFVAFLLSSPCDPSVTHIPHFLLSSTSCVSQPLNVQSASVANANAKKRQRNSVSCRKQYGVSAKMSTHLSSNFCRNSRRHDGNTIC